MRYFAGCGTVAQGDSHASPAVMGRPGHICRRWPDLRICEVTIDHGLTSSAAVPNGGLFRRLGTRPGASLGTPTDNYHRLPGEFS